MNSEIEESEILIIGAGWAGLSAAIPLIEQGKQVCIIDSAKAAGGRARCVSYRDYNVDNGTHIMVGAYTQTLALIKKVHKRSVWNETLLLERQSLNLSYKQRNNTDITLPAIPLPAPLNIVFSFLFASGVSFKDKLQILSLGLKIKLNIVSLPSDINLKNFLKQQNQSLRIIKSIWEPLCIAILNTPIALASTEIFLRVLKDSFFKSGKASNLLFFKTDLSVAFPIPAQKYIEQHKGLIHFNRRATSITKEDNHYIINTKLAKYKAKHVVIATAPIATKNLLSDLTDEHNALINNLNAFTYQPICTVYLQYPKEVSCGRTMQGFLGTTVQWVFNKSSEEQPNLISVVISSEGSHMDWSNTELIKKVTDELAEFYQEWPQPDDAFVIREKRATFTASVNINRIRPSNKTDIHNIWLAGDYTNTHYPATLEGAVRSGHQCAQHILAEF